MPKNLTKAERKALKRKEAALVAELDNRAAASVKVKPSKSKREPDLSELKAKALRSIIADKTNGKTLRNAAKAELASRTATLVDDAVLKPVDEPKATESVKPTKSAKVKVIETAERVLAEASSPAATEAAETALEAATEASDDESDESIKARVRAKREARAALAAEADNVDRADAEAVKAHNAKVAELGGGHFLTSDDERERMAKRLAGEAEPTPEPVVTEVETERGRVFEAGVVPNPADDRGFAIPSDIAPLDFETNGNGQYKVKRPGDGKLVGYTRVTTYIGTNEDRTMLERWKLRVMLEGVALHDLPDAADERVDQAAVKMRGLIHARDVALAKARKDDRKGKLVPGQYGTLVDAAWSEYKRAADDLAETLLDIGGAHEKAAKGTELHELFELYDREGIEAVGALVESGKITPADLADVEAYGRAIEAAGIKIIPEHIEQPIVIDELKVAGRLDRVVMARMPGAARAARYVLDVKSGRIDYSAGKIAQQLELYSRGETYNLETHERGKHGASRTKALVLHLTPGSAEAHIYPVDLGTGRVGNDISAKVRAYRNDGRRAIDTSVDLAKPEVVA